MPLNEADTCTRLILPKLHASGWDADPHSFREQHVFTDGRILVLGNTIRRKPQKRADYLLKYTRDFTIAVIEAKPQDSAPGEGLQQAKQYAEILGLKFAYATNGELIIEFDYLTGQERELTQFPTPAQLWQRLQNKIHLNEPARIAFLEPYNLQSGKSPRYYQDIAIHRAVEAVLRGQHRSLLTMATGTGKTVVAFQICWKLWNARWNRTGEFRRPKILYLADRNILIDDPKDKTFAPFADARWKIENGQANKGREMYFAIYQALAKDERRPGLYKEYPPDFFDLIIVDECHRGAANDQSNWREILDYFQPAFQLGMTATPKRQDNINTYAYFGDPIYTYSLRQGIDDGFLAPYRVHRIITSWDAAGWRPSQSDIDRFGRAIPDEQYETKDFERIISLKKRTEAIAKHLSDFLKATDRFAKTIVFCVDQEHADDMRRALVNQNSDLVQQFPDYVCRVVSDEADIGRGHLSHFQDVERTTPVILTTSQMLTTGVDAPTCKNIVLARVINSMTDFKQIIGRGTRVNPDAGKLWFSILDYTGSATRLFADPDFDGDPVSITATPVDEDGNPTEDPTEETTPTPEDTGDTIDVGPVLPGPDAPAQRRKFYFDGGHVEISAHLVSELDADGKQLRIVRFTDYAADKIRILYTSADQLRSRWSDPVQRKLVLQELLDRGIDFDHLAATSGHPEADPFDLLCHLAFNAPLHSRSERARRLRTNRPDFFARYGPDARAILNKLLDKYTDHGTAQFELPDILQVPPISDYGNPMEIAHLFGGPQQLRQAVDQLQASLYQ
jgi:type I restriction enzyme, R subunit